MILPLKIAPVFGPGRTRMFYKGVDLGLCAFRLPPECIDDIWFVPFATLIGFIGGEVSREKGKVSVSAYGKSAVFTEESDTAQTDKGEVRLEAPVYRGREGQLYIPLDSACKIFNMKWAYAKRNNYLTIETVNESQPVPVQP